VAQTLGDEGSRLSPQLNKAPTNNYIINLYFFKKKFKAKKKKAF
jgi:hypothetical protein